MRSGGYLVHPYSKCLTYLMFNDHIIFNDLLLLRWSVFQKKLEINEPEVGCSTTFGSVQLCTLLLLRSATLELFFFCILTQIKMKTFSIVVHVDINCYSSNLSLVMTVKIIPESSLLDLAFKYIALLSVQVNLS